MNSLNFNSQPHLSSRMNVLKPEGAYAVLAKAQELEAQGKDITHLEIGQPDFPTPEHIVKAGIRAIQSGKTKYNPPLGVPEFRTALAQSVNKTRSTSITHKNIAVTPSGKAAIFAVMMATLEEGDEVMYPNPGFPTYKTLIDVLRCKGIPVPLIEENGFSFDMEAFEKGLSEKTKLIIINSPSNPTGGVIRPKDLDRIAELVIGKNIWIMTDEIYSHIVYDEKLETSFYAHKKLHEQMILVDGFSKTFSMTGWRLGYIAAPERIMDKIDYLLTHMIGCTATFTQYAGLAAIMGPQDDLKRMVDEFTKRRTFVVERLNAIKGVSCIIPEGAFYAFPNVSSFGKTSKEIADHLLKEAGVALLPGTDFGTYGQGYIRLSYATSMKELKKGLDKIEQGLQSL